MAENDFSITLNPCKILKKGISLLCDAEFNPKQWGFMEVGENGGSIIVVGDDKKLRFINFKADHSIRFKKMIDIGGMKEGLEEVNEDDIVTIHHVNGLNNLVVEIASSGETFDVAVLGDFPDYKRGLDLCYGFGTIEESGSWVTQHVVKVYTPSRKSNIFAGDIVMGPRHDMTEWDEDLVDKVLDLTFGTGKQIKLFEDDHGITAIIEH